MALVNVVYCPGHMHYGADLHLVGKLKVVGGGWWRWRENEL